MTNSKTHKYIKPFTDGSHFYFAQGKFDTWCVFYSNAPSKPQIAHTDLQMLEAIKGLSDQYGADKIYSCLYSIFMMTQKSVNTNMYSNIEHFVNNISMDNDQRYIIGKVFLWYHLTMIAEENKAYTKLGGKIKMLSIYQVIKENMSPTNAANFSRGRSYKTLLVYCAAYNIL